MGSPRPCAGAKAPSTTLIVRDQSCMTIHGSHSRLEKSSSLVAHCDRCPLEDFSISTPPFSTFITLHSALQSWDRAARHDPGLLNPLPKTLLLKWVRVHLCVFIDHNKLPVLETTRSKTLSHVLMLIRQRNINIIFCVNLCFNLLLFC